MHRGDLAAPRQAPDTNPLVAAPSMLIVVRRVSGEEDEKEEGESWG